ncbi:MAG TPA: SAM-dependent methyltransferase [Caldilineae bacterium]|nr:SAM-dependent methyltransferase [Caldilineae bacterium]
MKRDNQVGAGLTAMALLRAIASSRPESERLFHDPVSRLLLPSPWRILLLPGLRHAFVAVVERLGPGALGNLLCRTRYIDDVLNDALKKGLDQVVILGAGFDCRPYRIPGINQTRVFEVDRPIPLRLKQDRLRKAFGRLPPHITFVPIDFDRQSLDEAMDAAGFRAGARTFFIWEGVTQYITAEAVDAVLHYVARSAQAGNEIVFTYIHRGIIDGSARTEADERIVSRARQSGMPWIFGFDPAELSEYLAVRGLTPIEEVGAPDYRRRYLDPINRRMKIFEGEKVVLAQIARKDERT